MAPTGLIGAPSASVSPQIAASPSAPQPQPLPPPAPPEPVLRLARAVPPARFELPHWLTQGRSPRPTVLALSEPPHDLALPPAPRPVVRPVATWAPPPPRSFAVVAASSGEVPYDGRPAGWYPPTAPGWPYGGPAQPYYGWSPPYGQAFLPN